MMKARTGAASAATRARHIGMLAVLSMLIAGCELIGNIFQAGFVVGIIIVVLLVAVIAWVMSRFRRR